MFLAAAIWLLNRGRGKIIIAVSHFADDSKTDGSEGELKKFAKNIL
jgi:hypothetical protein